VGFNEALSLSIENAIFSDEIPILCGCNLFFKLEKIISYLLKVVRNLVKFIIRRLLAGMLLTNESLQ